MAYYILLLFYPHYIRKTCPPSIKLLWFSGPSTLTHDISLFQYPVVIKHGLLECPLFIADFPNKTLPFMEDFTIFSYIFPWFYHIFSKIFRWQPRLHRPRCDAINVSGSSSPWSSRRSLAASRRQGRFRSQRNRKYPERKGDLMAI